MFDQFEIYITFAVLIASVFLFLTEYVSIIVTSLSIPIILTLTGIITPAQTFLGFANDNVILFASMFVIGGAIFKTGTAEKIGDIIVSLTNGDERKFMIGIWFVTSLFSAFLSNTGTVAVLLPVCIAIADTAGWKRKNSLIMLAMTASTAGMITLVGTPPNITVNALLQQNQLQGFSFFEFARIGIPLTILSGIFLFLSNGFTFHKVSFHKNNVSAALLQFNYRQLASLIVLILVILSMTFNIVPLHIASAIGALLCIVSGLINEKEAIESIDWTTICLFAGTLTLSSALNETGAGKVIANAVILLIHNNTSELLLLTVLFFLTAFLTQFMSNTALCSLIAPIGLQIAESLHANPRGVLIVIAIASSSAFATPMATPPNTLILGPGQLNAKDYFRNGIPLILISYLICIFVVPKAWPLYG